MNFDEAYSHVKDGTADEAERRFVDAEMQNLRRIRAILDEPSASGVVAPAEEETLQRARRQFNRKTTVKILVIVLCSLMAIAALVCGILFIPSCTSAARNQNLGEEEAVSLALQEVEKLEGALGVYAVDDVDRELRLTNGLNHAVYVYEVEIKTAQAEYTMEVSTKTGFVILTDVDSR